MFFEEAIQVPVGAEQLPEVLEGDFGRTCGAKGIAVVGGASAERQYLYLPELIELDPHPPRYHILAASGQVVEPITEGPWETLGGPHHCIGLFALLLLENFEQLGSLAHPVCVIVRIDAQGGGADPR